MSRLKDKVVDLDIKFRMREEEATRNEEYMSKMKEDKERREVELETIIYESQDKLKEMEALKGEL